MFLLVCRDVQLDQDGEGTLAHKGLWVGWRGCPTWCIRDPEVIIGLLYLLLFLLTLQVIPISQTVFSFSE